MKTMLMRSILCIYALFGSYAFAKTASTSLDQIVAVVNEDVVTKSELKQALSLTKIQLNQEHAPVPSETALNKQTLDQLINKKLQLQMANQAGITVSDEDLGRAVENIAKQNNMTVDMLYDRITHDGMQKETYLSTMRDQMTMQKIQQQEVISRITITPSEVDSFMRSKLWQNNGSKEYHLEDILIALSDTPSTEEIIAARKRAQDVVVKLHGGQAFHEAAQVESSNPNALKGGDLGWMKLPEIPTAFAEQVVHLQPKEIAGPIQTSNGFHIVRLTDTRTAASEQAAPNKKQIENLLLQRKFEEAIQNWVSKLRSQAFISVTDKA